MKISYLVALVCLCCSCVALAESLPVPRTWHVPDDVATLPEALALANPADVIELAMGTHMIAGRGHVLPAGITIRCRHAVPGDCILKEVATGPGDWRDGPVFIQDTPGQVVHFRGITFDDWNLAQGPCSSIVNPIVLVVDGPISFKNCVWRNFYTQCIHVAAGSGHFADCEFSDGCGCPAAISFEGGELVLERCAFRDLRWANIDGEWRGSIMHLRGGETRMIDCRINHNGPLVRLLRIEAGATLMGCQSCLGGNNTRWEARLAGTAYMDCCEICVPMWEIVDGGQLVLLDPTGDPGGDKTMQSEPYSWSQVKSLFD